MIWKGRESGALSVHPSRTELAGACENLSACSIGYEPPIVPHDCRSW